MSSRPSTYHTETLAENRRLQEKIQTLQKDIRECWSIVNEQDLRTLEEKRCGLMWGHLARNRCVAFMSPRSGRGSR